MSGTSWLLGAGYPWFSGTEGAEDAGSRKSRVIANAANGLSLATLPDGTTGLGSADGSLGGLTLPLGVAVDGNSVYLLSRDGRLVWRYDDVLARLVPLAHVGAEGLHEPDEAAFRKPRRFRDAANIAALRGELYVADPAAQRVQVFDLSTLALLRIHEGLRDPVDVAASSNAVYILDRGAGSVYRATPGSDRLEVVARHDHDPCRTRQWDRLAVDRQERLYLRFPKCDSIELDVYATGDCCAVDHPRERVYDSEEVRDRFAVPRLGMDANGALVLPAELSDPCGLRRPLDESVPRWEIGKLLYVADAESRKLRVHLADGRVRHQFGPLDATGQVVDKDAADAWLPAGVVALGGCAAILDAIHQTIYLHRPGDSALRRAFSAVDAGSRWRRLAVDPGGCLLLWDGTGDDVERFDGHGASLGTVRLREVRGCFDAFTSTRQPAAHHAELQLTRRGALPLRAGAAHHWPADTHHRQGTWTSQWLDSDLYNCSWHVIELSVARMPAGSRIQVRTRTSNDPQSLEQVRVSGGDVGAGSWRDLPVLVAPAQPDPEAPASFAHDILVPNAPGQHLQLQVVLSGNGISTPRILRARLRFPRDSLLQYLPAIYSSPPAQQEFLDRYLSIAQTTWTAIEREVDSFDRYLDADSVPDDALGWLAGWLDLRLEGTWSSDQNRRLVAAMPKLREGWGTPEGLRRWLRVYLANLAGIDEAALEKLGVPGIVESFVDRRRLRLGAGGATLCHSHALWSPAVERRFQVGVFDRLGDVELVSTGHPDFDVFQHYAHTFRVFVPSALIRTPEQESLLRRAIELHKPAHTTYELVLVEPRLRVGDQSTLELDTVIGAPLPGPLLCPERCDPPSRPPHQRLGFDTTLGRGPHAMEPQLERRLA